MSFENGKKMSIYLMGICGTAMASLAGMLQQLGHEVRGSDQNVYPPMSDMLTDLGIEVREGYKPSNLEPRPDLVIVGNVMSKGHPEVEALLNSDIPYTSLAACIGENIIGSLDSYVVAGTHGKSTTTSLMTWAWECLGLEPGYMVGAIPANFEYSFRAPQKSSFVIEGDEYDTAFFDKVPKFKHYRPKFVVLNAVEFDHADIYKDLDAVKDAFHLLLERIPEDGVLIYKSGDENIESLLSKYDFPKFSFGKDGDYSYGEVKFDQNFMSFDVSFKGEFLINIETPMMGEFNVWNILSVVAMAHYRSFDLDEVKKAMKTFKGLKRRQELIYDKNNIKVYEDFAHHPTAVSLCVNAVKDRFPDAKLHCFFEPRSATSRRKVFQKEYVKAFEKADRVFIKEAFNQTKIAEEDRFSSKDLVMDLQEKGVDSTFFDNTDQLLESLQGSFSKGDRILIMSNGAFDSIYTKIEKIL